MWIVPWRMVRNKLKRELGACPSSRKGMEEGVSQGWRRGIENPERRELEENGRQHFRWLQDMKILPLLRFA